MKITWLILAVQLIVSISCAPDRKEETSIQSSIEYPDQESWQATIRITKDGNTVGLLQAGHVQKYSKKNITLLGDSLTVDFFDNEGNHTSVLHSAGGKIYDDRQDMTAFGNVSVVSDSGLILLTDTLHWHSKEQKIYSNIAVKLISDDADTLFGDSFKSDPDLVNYEIVNPRGKSSLILKIE